MHSVTFHFIRNNEPDEILKVFKVGSNLYKCAFIPGNVKSSYSFKVTKSQLLDYVDTMLRAVVKDDVDPYEQVQVSTMIHPRILFHVSDMTSLQTVDRAWEMFISVINFPIVKNGLSSNQQTRSNAHSQRVPNSQEWRYFNNRINPEDSDS